MRLQLLRPPPPPPTSQLTSQCTPHCLCLHPKAYLPVGLWSSTMLYGQPSCLTTHTLSCLYEIRRPSFIFAIHLSRSSWQGSMAGMYPTYVGLSFRAKWAHIVLRTSMPSLFRGLASWLLVGVVRLAVQPELGMGVPGRFQSVVAFQGTLEAVVAIASGLIRLTPALLGI
jgi:hypothetical protein